MARQLRVRLVRMEEGKDYNGDCTTTVTLREDKTGRKVRCEDILIVDFGWRGAIREAFDEWMEEAERGTEGYTIL